MSSDFLTARSTLACLDCDQEAEIGLLCRRHWDGVNLNLYSRRREMGPRPEKLEECYAPTTVTILRAITGVDCARSMSDIARDQFASLIAAKRKTEPIQKPARVLRSCRCGCGEMFKPKTHGRPQIYSQSNHCGRYHMRQRYAARRMLKEMRQVELF